MVDEDELKTIWLWIGKDATLVAQRKARLFCEKAARNTSLRVSVVHQGSEPKEFVDVFGDDDVTRIGARNNKEVEKLQTMTPIIKLHEMHMGDGFLELPQVVPAGRAIRREMLASNNVYIVDHWSDMYIWVGRKSRYKSQSHCVCVCVCFCFCACFCVCVCVAFVTHMSKQACTVSPPPTIPFSCPVGFFSTTTLSLSSSTSPPSLTSSSPPTTTNKQTNNNNNSGSSIKTTNNNNSSIKTIQHKADKGT